VADVPARAAGHATEAAEDVLLHALEAVEIEVGAGGKRDPHHVGPVEPLRLELEGGVVLHGMAPWMPMHDPFGRRAVARLSGAPRHAGGCGAPTRPTRARSQTGRHSAPSCLPAPGASDRRERSRRTG